jgi:hypothetical protein
MTFVIIFLFHMIRMNDIYESNISCVHTPEIINYSTMKFFQFFCAKKKK